MKKQYINILFVALILLFTIACKNNDDNNNTDNTDMVDNTTDDVLDEVDIVTDDGVETQNDTIRFATFNVSMFGDVEGELNQQLNLGVIPKFAKIAEIIKTIRPDVLALMEFDFDSNNENIELFKSKYLEQQLDQAAPIEYAYYYQIPSNTGLLSTEDFDQDGNLTLPNDAYGFGEFNGQYAFAILSKYPIDITNMRSFQTFLWKDMPNALLPQNTNGSSYYSEEALNVFRLSSKNHVDIPVTTPNGSNVHVILAHPTPPIFDGTEDRNGLRNHDEIRLLADYVNNATYLVDDNGQSGGLSTSENFVIMGDLNADPYDGDSANEAILQLLNNTEINNEVCFGNFIPSSTGGAEHNQSSGDIGDPAYDTSFFGLRIDYVLPSDELQVINSGVFWPSSSEENYFLIENQSASDHLMVWVDVVVE